MNWNYRNNTFHNEWQAYRTKKQAQIEIATQWRYDEPGTYALVIKVIDILGNDTTKLVEVEVN